MKTIFQITEDNYIESELFIEDNQILFLFTLCGEIAHNIYWALMETLREKNITDDIIKSQLMFKSLDKLYN